jgi:predicted membrane protein
MERTPTFLISVITGVVSIVLSFLAAICFLAANSWFGAGDLTSFAQWSIMFAVVSVCVAVIVRVTLLRRSAALRYFLAAFCGLVTGYAFTWVVALLLGPWFRAFSFPVLYCWMLAGLGSMLFTVSVARHNAV